MYQVETKQLKRQVKRNIERFPQEFMFELTLVEYDNLRSQIGTSSWGGSRYAPMAFTEHGVLMLSSIINSAAAIQVNITIIKIFTHLREALLSNKDVLLRLEQLDKKLNNVVFKQTLQGSDIETIFEMIGELRQTHQQIAKPRSLIGYPTKAMLDATPELKHNTLKKK